ncbi:MAG TPA: succinate dehydrogenase assembly factor 2 [Gammaproteobacteria bacterium]|nr:succinate dehydrogenase assembly factor 2 [Gammaproteobacteria bacterium]
MSEQARLKWLCRRGMKELDVLLEHYLEHEYPRADEEERAAFRELLECQDPVLWDYVMERDQPGSEVTRNVVRKLVSALRA